MNKKNFGKHLTFDGYGINKKLLSSFDYVFKFLDEMPNKINMKKLTTPYVVICKPKNKIEWGISGFVMIYTSHISCHTWPEKNYVSIDVYSCRDFDERKIMELLKKYWNPSHFIYKVIKRG